MKKKAGVLIVLGLFTLLNYHLSPAQQVWIKDTQNNPVFTGGQPGTWDYHVFMPHVLYDAQTSTYEMWYDASFGPPHWRPYWIGYATSSDGITWNKLDTAVFKPTPGTWDESTVEGQYIIKESNVYKMWYSGCSAMHPRYAIGYATSPDGIHWTKDTLNNPVLDADTAQWEIEGVGYCTVLSDSGSYKMWYVGLNTSGVGNIGYATSTDGINWEKYEHNPVLLVGSATEWDGKTLSIPKVFLLDSMYHLYYSGYSPDSSRHREIGYAWSEDELNWTKYDDPSTVSAPYAESDPVIRYSPGQWDGDATGPGNPILIGDSLHMWYQGNRYRTTVSYPWLIGHAVSCYVPPTGLKFTSDIQPEAFLLYQNYPNPFNPKTTISWQLAVGSTVKLEIFNLMGQKITTLLSASLPSGSHSVEWDASDMASGVYLYRIRAGDYIETKKMILMK